MKEDGIFFLRMEIEDPTRTMAEIKPTIHVQPRVFVLFFSFF